MASVMGGIIVLVLSIYFLLKWWGSFLIVIKGFLPFSFFIAGVIAVVSGISGVLAKKTDKLKTKPKKTNE